MPAPRSYQRRRSILVKRPSTTANRSRSRGTRLLGDDCGGQGNAFVADGHPALLKALVVQQLGSLDQLHLMLLALAAESAQWSSPGDPPWVLTHPRLDSFTTPNPTRSEFYLRLRKADRFAIGKSRDMLPGDAQHRGDLCRSYKVVSHVRTVER